MNVDKVTFLAMTATLAAGAAGGYLYHRATTPQVAVTTMPSEPIPAALPPPAASARAEASVAVPEMEAPPACDDNVGSVSDCPVAVSSEDEGICKNGMFWAGKRCADFKADMKPKVADLAVQCLRGLKGADQCDQNRANLCGHQALMLACQENLPASQATVTSLTVGRAPPLPTDASPLAAQCQTILKGCGSAAPAASFAECYRTLSGLNETGRGYAVECMKTHCSDKGFLGCEAPTPPVKATVAQY